MEALAALSRVLLVSHYGFLSLVAFTPAEYEWQGVGKSVSAALWSMGGPTAPKSAADPPRL